MTKFAIRFFNDFAIVTPTRPANMAKRALHQRLVTLKGGLKKSFGLSQQQMMSSLTYLIDKEWINKNEVEKTVQGEPSIELSL